MHLVFAQVPFKMSELEKECERLALAEKRVLSILSAGDETERWVAKTSGASGVESLFTGMEGVLKLLIEAMGEKVYQTTDGGPHKFHAQLIAQCATATEIRPVIISNELKVQLDDLRRFRHLERNVYGEALIDEKVDDKVKAVLEVVPRFKREVEAFIAFMSTPKPVDEHSDPATPNGNKT